MQTSEFIIRSATPDDAGQLCRLIHALAEFEQLAEQAAPDPDALASHLAQDANPRCHAFLAMDSSGRAVGFALYFRNYSTFLTGWGIHLEDIFVESEFRGRGIGQSLLDAVVSDAVTHGCERLDLNVLDWNSSAIDFYAKRGAEALSDWIPMRFAGSALQRLATSPAK